MLLQMKNVKKAFVQMDVLKNLTLEIYNNEIVCIIGPSGCGKSTMLNIISGVLEHDEGEVKSNIDRISYVFQEDRLLPWKSVYENIKIVNREQNQEGILNLIEKVGLKGFENYYPNELSGGMRQRCSIARAFNFENDLLLMDEPFKSLDYNLRFKMIEQLLNLWEIKKNAIIFVTHEIDEALLLGDRIYVLSNRPTRVKEQFVIDKSKWERSLKDEELVGIRNKIIEMLI